MDTRMGTVAEAAVERLRNLPAAYGFTGPEIELSGEAFPAIVRVKYRRKQEMLELRLVLEYLDTEYVATVVHYHLDASSRAHRQIVTTSTHSEPEMRRALDAQCSGLRERLRGSRDLARM